MDGFDLSSFQDWIQQVGGNYLQTKTQAQYDPQLQLAKLQLQQQAQNGQLYLEGQPGTASMTAGIPTAWLLLGGAALIAVVMLKG